MLTSKIQQFWRRYTTYDRDHPPGSGYCKEQWTEEHEVKEFYLFNFKVWTSTLSVRHVPEHEVISSACLGSRR